MILKIGLTGGIGSGKTTVAKIFELLNAPVYYADAVSKSLYTTDKALMQNIKQHFGEDMYAGDVLDRRQMASIVFSNPEKLALLNSLVHPPTLRHAEEWMQQQTAPYLIKEAALLFETGSAGDLHYIIGVHTPKSIRLKRVMDRDGISRQEVLNRMDRQVEESIKMKLCDFVIDNSEQQLVIPQVLQLHQHFLQLSGAS